MSGEAFLETLQVLLNNEHYVHKPFFTDSEGEDKEESDDLMHSTPLENPPCPVFDWVVEKEQEQKQQQEHTER